MLTKNKFLVCYNPGSRGDFLIVLIVGHGQGASFTNTRIIHDYLPNTEWGKLHYYDNWYGPLSYRSFPECTELCNSFRISIASDREKLDSILLFKSKIEGLTDVSNLRGLLALAFEFENYYSKFDQHFDHVISFDQMFDLDFLVNLYHNLYNTQLSDQVIKSLSNNIKINLEHINTVHAQVGDREIQDLLEFCHDSVYHDNKDLFLFSNTPVRL